MSEILTTPKYLSEFYAFAPTAPTGAYDAAKRQKQWADPNPTPLAPGAPLVMYSALALNTDGTLMLNADKQPFISKIVMPLSEAKAVNFFPNAANAGEVMPGGPWPFPIDPAKWDSENYYLELQSPFATTPVVKDKRADALVPVIGGGFTDADRTLLKRIGAVLGVS
jgi:hypothetical protein